MGHKTPSMAGVKSTVGLISPATDSVASMLSTRWHFSIWPCHRLARAGVHHFHAGRACECLHPHLTTELRPTKKTPTRPRKQRFSWSEGIGYQLNKSFFFWHLKEKNNNLKTVTTETSETPANQGIQSDSVSSGWNTRTQHYNHTTIVLMMS